MTDIFIDPKTDDISLTNKVMRLTNTVEELTRQRVQIWLNIFRGEWFANVLAGIPYLRNDNNTIQLLGATSKETFDLFIREGITTRVGILRLASYTSVLDKESRFLSISFEAVTETGDLISVNNVIIEV